MEIITAQEARQMKINSTSSELIQKFNTKLTDAIQYNDRSFYLSFDEFGYDYEDIQFVVAAGYKVDRNGACLWWEVFIPSDYD